MTRARVYAIGFIAAACAYAGKPACAQTLGEAIATAYATNPRLAAARARQEAQAEAPVQARAVGRPTLAINGDASHEDGASGAASASVTLAVPIWTGGRVSSAVRAAQGDVAAGAETLRDVEADILQSVVVAYAALLYHQQAVEIARVGIERLDQQVAEARSRYELGQATRTDLAQLEAQRAAVIANLADADGALAIAAEDYNAAVGQQAGSLTPEVPPPALLPGSLAEARDEAKLNNPRLLRQRHIAEASSARVDQARAERAPSADIVSRYGGGRRYGSDAGGAFDDDASIGVTFRVPLFSGGLVTSRIKEARAMHLADQYEADAAERAVVRAAGAAWASLANAEARLNASTEGLSAADLALRGVRAEYGFGLRSTTDVLVADQTYRMAQLAVAAAQTDVIIAQAGLLRAAGKLGRDAYS